MAEVVGAVVGATTLVIQAKTTLWDPLKQTIASSNDMNEVYEALIGAKRTLVAKREDHNEMVERHKATRIPSNAYQDWIDRVKRIESEVQSLQRTYVDERKRSSWCCIHPRSSFTNKMKKAALEVFALKDEHVDVLVPKKRASVVDMIAPRITNIPTLQQTLDKTLVLLSDSQVSGIRIHGVVGCGKTTVMQNLNNHPEVAKMFDIVIWVTVSREECTKNKAIDELQQAITQRLKLDINDCDAVTSTIKEELKDMKYLLLLDDVKEDLNLDQIGVPISDNGSKIVFTTRLRRVCDSYVTRQINVKTLNNKEALDMFKSVLDRPDLEKNSNFSRLMPLVVNWCHCHPLLIKVAAGMFKSKETEQSWHDGITKLQIWPQKGDEAMKEICKLLKVGFDCLNVNEKKCFFYGALYPEDSNIQKDSLLDNWAAEELLGINGDAEDMRANGRDILDFLKMASLLEENTSQSYIRMHKVIRLAALYIMSTDETQNNLVKSGEALLRQPPTLECWKEKRWISLVDSKMDTLPNQPNCSMLSTLFLQKNPKLKVIPLAFFEHMQSLRVLDLYDARITSLPTSLLDLVTLKVLCLQKCATLVELPSEIEHLKELEVLDVRGSGLVNIPPQIQRLICLRRLLVSFTSSSSSTAIQKANIDCKVISTIPKLKELVIDVKEEFKIILYGAILKVVDLSKFSLLQFHSSSKVIDVTKVIGDSRKTSFHTEELFQSYIDKVSNFKEKSQIFIGCDIALDPPVTEFMPHYRFAGNITNTTILDVLCNEVAIELVNHNDLEHLSTFPVESLNRIRSCVIKDCKKVKTAVNGNIGGSSILNNVEQLHLINLPVLKNIYEGPTQGFSSLKTLILCNCPELKSVCTNAVILHLPEIRHLEVKSCSRITEMFKLPTNIMSPILPKLEKLILVDMPQLISILESDTFEWPSLEELEILGCPKLKRLPFRKDTAVKLTLIKAEQSWWEALVNEEEVKEQFRQRCTLSCG